MLGKLRTLASDALIYGLTTILVRFMTFLLTPLYSNYLSKTEIGVFTDLLSVIGFVTILYCLGLDTSFFRFFVRDNVNRTKEAFSYSFWGIFTVGGFFTLMVFIFADSIALYFPEINSRYGSSVIRMAALIPLCDVLTFIPYAVLRMNRRAKVFAGLKIMTVAVNVIATYLMIAVFKMGIMGIVIAGIISSGIAFLAFIPIIIKWLTPLRGGKTLLKEMLVFGLPTVPSALSLMVLQLADRPIMKAIGGPEMLGMYSVNYRLALPMLLIVAVFEFAWRPFYLSNHEEEDSKQLFSRILTYFTLCCALVFLIVSFGMEYVVRMPFVGGRFINPAFWSGMGIIPIVMGGYFFNGIFTNLAAGFHITKRTKFLPIATVIAAASNVLLNIILIPKYGIYGGAWATFGAYFLSMIVLYYYSRTIYPVPYEWKRIFLIIIVTLGIFWGVNALPDMIWTKILAVVVLVAFFRFTGFFNAEEIAAIKRLVGRKPKVSDSN